MSRLWRSTIMFWPLDDSWTTSPLRTWYEGIVTRLPFTVTWPWRTHWRDWLRLDANPARNTTLSSRSSSIRSRFSPVMPLWPAAWA